MSLPRDQGAEVVTVPPPTNDYKLWFISTEENFFLIITSIIQNGVTAVDIIMYNIYIIY